MNRLRTEKTRLIRVAPVIVLSALIALHSASLSLGAGKAGDFVRCLTACSSMFRECRAGCRDVCRQNPPWSQERRMCQQVCLEDCKTTRNECRNECKIVKPPPSPVAP